MKKLYFFMLSIILLTASVSGQTTITVGPSGADHTTIQAAIAAASSGDIIQVAAGTYIQPAQLIIDKNLTITGAEKTTTFIKAGFNSTGGSSTDPGLILVQTGVTLSLSGFTIDGDYPNYQVRMGIITYGTGGLIDNNIFTNLICSGYDGRGVVVYGTNISISNNTFTNIGRIGIHVRKAYAGLQVATNITVAGNNYTGKGIGDHLDYGVEVGAAASATVSGNTVTECKGIASTDGSTSAGFLATDYYGTGTVVIFSNNTLANNKVGIAMGYAEADETAATISGNTFTNHSDNNIQFTKNINTDLDAVYTSNTFDQCVVITDGTNILTGSTFHTHIQDAIDAATAGDVIEVAAGTYVETPLIGKTIVLKGPNHNVIGSGTRNPEAVVEGAIRVEANGVTIKGFMIDGTNVTQSTNLTMRGILVANTAARSNVTIQNNIIQNWVTGISLAGGASYPWVDGAHIEGNLFKNNGIGSTENVKDLTVINNTFDNGGVGLGGGAVLSVPITGNSFSNATSRYISAASGVVADFTAMLSSNTFNKAAFTNAAAGQWYDRAIFATINGAIAVSAAGATITVAAGTYTEDISLSQRLNIAGAGSDATTGSILIGSINLGSGNSSTERTTFEGFRLVSQTSGAGNGITAGSYVSLSDIVSTGFLYGMNLSNGQDLIIDGCGFIGNAVGMKIGSQVSYADITITNSAFDNNTQHGWYSDANSTTEPSLDNVQISYTSFSNNSLKGFYTERLSNSVLEGLTINNNGDASYQWSAGVDFNLKWKDYQNVSLINSTITSNALGATNGAAITAKGRADAPSYSANPGTLTNFTFSGNLLQGNERGLVIGEPLKTDAGVSGALINNNRFEGTINESIINHHSPNTPDATCNWWGQAAGPGSGDVSGDVDYTPWLASNDISNPVCLGGAPNVFLDENFDNPVELFDANVSQRWYVDRYVPAAFESFNFNGENVLKIATGPGSANRGSQSSTFYNTHGRKFNQGGLGAVTLAGDLYIPADWANNHRRSGMWATMQNASGTITNYPILSFRNVDGANPTFSYWTSATGWNDVSNPILYDNWNNFEYKLWNGIAYYYINGELVGTEADASSLEIQNVILQIYNFDDPALPANEQDPGSNYVAYWDNISTTTGGPVHNVSQNTYHTTIQSAIDAAIAGDVIEVAAGTYEEQLHITTNNLTIRGDDKATTSILSPTNLTEYFNSGSSDNYPVVFIDGVAQCTIENFTIDGDGRGNANYRYQGIGFWNAGGTVDNVDVKGIMDTPLSGSQHGVAVYAYNNTPATNYTLSLSNMTIEDYQKNAMALNGSDNLTANLDNITTIGAGPTPVTAQNGIQFWGAQGSINNSSVTGNIYTGSGWSSAGIMLYLCQNDVYISNTTITDNFVGLDVNDANGSISNSTITNSDPDSWDGMYLRNPSSNTMSFDITNTTVQGSGKTDSWGVYLRAYANTVTSNMSYCEIDGWDYGVRLNEAGGTVILDADHSKFTANTVSYYSNAAAEQDASLNYWGAVEPDFNALISGDVEFCPYYTDELMTNESCPEVSNTTQGTTHYTLQAAVNAASTNDVIEITAGGTFDGIVLNTGESITLINSSGEEVIIRGASPALTVTSGTMTVDGITYTTSTDDPTILINGGNLIIRNCIIEESTGFTQSCIKIESGTLDAGLGADHGENTFITDGNAKAIINQTATTAEAIGNYWGTLVYNDIANLMTGPVNFDPWCNDDFSVCGYSTNTAGPITTIEGTLEDAGTNPVIVPITVENFTDVDALSIRITYDPTTVTLQDVSSATLPGYGGVLPGGLSAWYSTTGTSIIIGWIDPSATGVNLADGSVLFNLHFTFNNTTTGGTSTLEFDDSDDTYCEYQNALIQAPFADDPQANYWIDGWVSNLSVSFTRAYDPTVEITAVPAGGESPYAYNWAGPATQTATTATITPTDGYGTYTVTVTDDLGAFVVGTYSYGPVHNIDTYLDYNTIQAAIDATETLDGHTIQVDAGSYTENVDVDKELSIIGDGATTTTISAGAGSGVDVTADNVTLDGFTISHSSVTGESDLGVKFLLCNSGTVQNCVLSSNSLGILLFDAGNCDILDNEFAYNAVGIYLEGTTDGLGNYDGGNNGPFYSLSLNNTISGNNIHHSVLLGGQGGQGIYLDAACEGNTITSNTITLSEGPGYYAWKASGNTITDNTITSNTSEGIHLFGSSDNTITGNVLSTNASGIRMRSGALSVNNNVITENDITSNTTGILMEDDFSGNNYVGTLAGNTIADNNISGNTNYGLQVLDVDASTFTDVDAEMNWWGAASGPTHSGNPCGTGDAVTDYVDYSPWYYQSGMATLNGLPELVLTDVQDISTITKTPLIVSVNVTYPDDLENYDLAVLTDARLTSDKAFPANAEVISVKYNGIESLGAAYSLNGETEVYLSEILGSAATPLAGHDDLSNDWDITLSGIEDPETYAIDMVAVSYIGTTTDCNNALGEDDFTLTWADASQSITGTTTTVCFTDPLQFSIAISYPSIANLNPDIKADCQITSDVAFLSGTVIYWDYNSGAASGSHTLSSDLSSLKLSDIVGLAPASLQGHSGTDTWTIEIVTDGHQETYTLTFEPIASLAGVDYPYLEDQLALTVNACGLSGLLTYYNTLNSPLPGETIELWKDGAISATQTTTSAAGTGGFSFPNLDAGTYEIRPQTTLPVKSINATDAAQVNYWQVNAPSSYIEKVRFMAGDVNRIDATDLTPDVLGSFEAYRILNYFVTNGTQGWINAPAWSFWKANDQILANNWTDGRYPTVEVSDESVTQNVYGLITGDFNRSYVPGAKKSASNTLFLNDGKNVLVDAGTPVSLPFTLQGRLEAGAFSVILEYPEYLVEVVGVNLTNNPNAPILYTAENGVLRIAWMNPQPIYLNAGDALFTLNLLTAENLGSNSVIRFSLAADPMNEVADGRSEIVDDVQLFADVLSNSFLGLEENANAIGINIFPNPVREQATLVYHLPENGNVKLELSNALGQSIQVLCNEMQTSGTHSIQLNANHLNAGVYFVNITLETATETLLNSRRLILQ